MHNKHKKQYKSKNSEYKIIETKTKNKNNKAPMIIYNRRPQYIKKKTN